MLTIFSFLLANWKYVLAFILIVSVYIFIYHQGYATCEQQTAKKIQSQEQILQKEKQALESSYDNEINKQKTYSNKLEQKLNKALKDDKNQAIINTILPSEFVRLYNESSH